MAKLMLVEDDNNLREIYEARLQAEGYTIVSAKDGEEALVVAKAEKPDLIIADIMMPKISGFEMLDILRNTDGLRDTKVIMLTALGQNDDQQRANQLGADRYLVKSQVTLEDIVQVAHELLSDQPAAAATPDPTKAAVSQPSTADPAAAPAQPEPPAKPPVDPATDPAPEPAPDPAADPKPAAPAATVIPVTAEPPEQVPSPDAKLETDSLAQSAAQEEVTADNRIEDFVAGATEEATAPPTAATPEPKPPENQLSTTDTAVPPETSVAAAPTTPEPAPPETPVQTPAADAAADDDKLVADAAQKLVDSTEDAETEADDTPSTAAMGDLGKPDDSNPDNDQPKAANNTKTTHSEKVITPLDDNPKQDLKTLLAVEEAKEAGTAPAPPATPIVVTDDPAGQTATPAQNPIIQPSSDVATPTVSTTITPGPTPSNDSPDPNQITL